jgi:leucyl-tRNA synthetase
MPVDQYIGGIEHAILHLLYSRFYTKVLRDMGYLDKIDEPFTNLLTQGMVCKETVKCPDHGYLYPEEAKKGICAHCGKDVEIGSSVKMSKSTKNVIDPQELIDRYGADTVRMFCLFAAPPERDLEWSDEGVEGSWRFLSRIWRFIVENREDLLRAESFDAIASLSPDLKNIYRKTHQVIKKVTEDIEDRFHFNTAVSAIMELFNSVNQYLNNVEEVTGKAWSVLKVATESMVILLYPIVPHITEELWSMLGHDESLATFSWPTYREEALEQETRLVVIQVNGKVRSKIDVPVSLTEEEIKEQALNDQRVQHFIADKEIKRVIVVQKKLVSVVV